MRKKEQRRSLLRSARFERFEERLAMSAQPLAALAPMDEAPMMEHFGEVTPMPIQQFGAAPMLEHLQAEPPALRHMGEPDFRLTTQVEDHATQAGDATALLNGVHDMTGVNYAYDTFGLSGRSQTVAVIDSGVDYLHGSLGGGLGAGHRVVGGYDFAEGDADPYDDGPQGFHGTHVAGIVGSDHASYRGVAPEADIVALRVFDDDGNGYFHWVEDALQWVHDNRDAFDNPITAVNLSLGAEWNSDSIPNWANLEDEFAQLEADGIFIAVAAGNSFSNYNSAGLSYPAVSPYVVPVASVNDNGLMSSFSQRNDRVLAAPGSSIVSTVPDHVFGADGNHNDFGGASGTSMAAPYVAGASVLVREAMEFAGMQNITQDVIYDHLRDTADMFFDSATSANYHRINLESAIDALMPSDDFGSTSLAAHNLGSLNGTSSFNGSIHRLDDADFFTFTAGVSGEMTLTANDSFNLDTSWQLVGGSASTSDSFSFDVEAGQSYTFSLTTQDGIGHYSVDANLQGSGDSAGPTTDWGQVASLAHDGISLDNAVNLYQLEASQAGLLTVEAFFAHSSGNVDLELVNANNNVVASSLGATDYERLDVTASAGELFTLRVSGQNDDVDFRLTNLVSQSGSQVTVNGADGDDVFSFTAGADHLLALNGVEYTFASTSANSFSFLGGAGDDAITIVDSSNSTNLSAHVGSLSLSGNGYNVSASSVSQTHVSSVGGMANLYDSNFDDSFLASPTTATLSGLGFQNTASGFMQVNAHSSQGDDSAVLNDSNGADQFFGRSGYSYLMGSGFLNQAIGFERVEANASQSSDVARLFGSDGDDSFYGRSEYSYLQGDNFLNIANNFENVNAYAGNGNDRAWLWDSEGDDVFIGRSGYSHLSGDGFTNVAHGFDRVDTYATTGNDRAFLYDTAGDEQFYGRSAYSYLKGENFLNAANNFDRVEAFSSGGSDTAILTDSAGDDSFFGRESYSYMSGATFLNVAHEFSTVTATAMYGGFDRAYLFDSSGDEQFYGRSNYAYMLGSGFLNTANSFDRVEAHSSGGSDMAVLTDSAGDDSFYGRSNYAYLTGDGFLNIAHQFASVSASSIFGGYDRAFLYDTTGDENFVGRSSYAFMQGSNFQNVANSFDRVEAFSSGGSDTALLTDSAGDDSFYGREQYSFMMGSGFINIAHHFDHVTANSLYGGNDQANLFGSTGSDTFLKASTFEQLSGNGFNNLTKGFDSTRAFGRGGVDAAVFQSLGAGDSIYGRDNYASLTDSDGDNVTVYDFEELDANSGANGSPDTDIESVDYVFEELGDWS